MQRQNYNVPFYTVLPEEMKHSRNRVLKKKKKKKKLGPNGKFLQDHPNFCQYLLNSFWLLRRRVQIIPIHK
jgi:hypothetical protein